MSRRFPPYDLVTLDVCRQPVTTGYVMSGLYGGLCACGGFVTFDRRAAVVDCPRCTKRYTAEPREATWRESRPPTTTTPSNRQPPLGRPSPPRWRSTPPVPPPTGPTRPTKGKTVTQNETPIGNPQVFDQEEEAVQHEEAEPGEEEEE